MNSPYVRAPRPEPPKQPGQDGYSVEWTEYGGQQRIIDKATGEVIHEDPPEPFSWGVENCTCIRAMSMMQIIKEFGITLAKLHGLMAWLHIYPIDAFARPQIFYMKDVEIMRHWAH
jgi:hypothetical protein